MSRRMAYGLAAIMTLAISASATIGADDEVPTPFARFEAMIGGWKGTGVPSTNRLKGWPESHSWAWKFVKGTPVGMTLAIEGGKVFTKGELSFNPATKKYTLAATDLAGKPIAYVGAISTDGKTLVLDRAEATADGKERLTIRLNGIRYTMIFDRQAPGAPQYKKAIEAGLTKEGESFAAGGGGADLPKCILTGGAAGMTVTYNGKSYPICCTGCRDEFNENPEKYVARAAAKAAAEGDKPAASPTKPAPAAGRGDGDFEGLVDAPKSKAMTKPSAKTKSAPSEEKAASKPAKGSAEDRANRDLTLGKAFERSGKTKQSLEYYKNIVKKYPETDAAKTAADRIKALDDK
jgi:YHS domain-containing protein